MLKVVLNKKRLDLILFERGLVQSREKARTIIMAGNVYVDNQKADKPGTLFKNDVKIEVRGPQIAYVSRGGLKLEKAIKAFEIDLQNKIAMDIGASTGGFTDCMLQNGAKKVYAVDVGYGQLDWKLRNDDRVVNLERTNIRYLDENSVLEKLNFFSVDVSFISLKLVLPVARCFMENDATAVCLIKPQFEAGRENVGKNGVVRDKNVHKSVISEICRFVLENGFDILGLNFSPIKGPKGNIEYLIYLRKSDEPANLANVDIENLVEASHKELNSGD